MDDDKTAQIKHLNQILEKLAQHYATETDAESFESDWSSEADRKEITNIFEKMADFYKNRDENIEELETNVEVNLWFIFDSLA